MVVRSKTIEISSAEVRSAGSLARLAGTCMICEVSHISKDTIDTYKSITTGRNTDSFKLIVDNEDYPVLTNDLLLPEVVSIKKINELSKILTLANE